MTKTYAIPDLHGRFDLLRYAISTIQSRAPKRGYTVVFLGDFIDRGPNSSAVIERMLRGPEDKATWICLKGNHEEMMRLAGDPQMGDLWLRNGGEETLASYPDQMVPIAHMKWLADLKLFHTDEHRVYVHAWIDRNLDLETQNPDKLLWERYRRDDQGGYRGRFVVHGHTPSVDGPHEFDGRLALDTLAWKTGRLPIAVFDDKIAGGPIEYLGVQMPDALLEPGA